MVLAGPGHEDEWPKIRAVIKTTEPTKMGRMLGVHHTETTEGTVTKTKISMTEYVKQAVDMYQEIRAAPPLKPRVNCPWYEPSIDEIKELS